MSFHIITNHCSQPTEKTRSQGNKKKTGSKKSGKNTTKKRVTTGSTEKQMPKKQQH